jgi:CrcB protein
MSVGLGVFLGGGAGALLRYGVSLFFVHMGWGFGATACVNMAGSCAMGFVLGMAAAYEKGFFTTYQTVLTAGFLGGFTTYSAFSAELWGLFQKGAFWQVLGYACGMCVCGVAAMHLGWVLGGGGH